MKKLLLTTLILSSSIFSGGCATTDVGAYIKGTEVTKDQMDFLAINYADKNEVIDRLGNPDRNENNEQGGTFFYDYVKIRHLGSNVSETTVFEFNRNGTLINKYKTDNDQKTGNAILDSMLR